MNDPAPKPNLFIIGAMKSGTTSLHEYLASHPQIAMSRVKEPGFFVEELSLDKGLDWYSSLFDADERYRYLGESSTHYTKLPVYRGVPERILQFNRRARLIYVMRDPFERIVSHYWHAVRDVYHGGELRPLLEAVRERPDYLAFGDYAMQLRPYFRLFGREAVFTLTFEALIGDPQREVDRIYDWLGLPRQPIAARAVKAHNEKPKEMIGVSGAGVLNRIEYSSAWHRISPYVPSSLKNLARKVAYRRVDEERSIDDIARLKKAIHDVQARQIDDLRHLLGRDFPEWHEPAQAPGAHRE
jgi:Sulfotransferase domain